MSLLFIGAPTRGEPKRDTETFSEGWQRSRETKKLIARRRERDKHMSKLSQEEESTTKKSCCLIWERFKEKAGSSAKEWGSYAQEKVSSAKEKVITSYNDNQGPKDQAILDYNGDVRYEVLDGVSWSEESPSYKKVRVFFSDINERVMAAYSAFKDPKKYEEAKNFETSEKSNEIGVSNDTKKTHNGLEDAESSQGNTEKAQKAWVSLPSIAELRIMMGSPGTAGQACLGVATIVATGYIALNLLRWTKNRIKKNRSKKLDEREEQEEEQDFC